METPGRLAELERKFGENPRRYFAALANEYRKHGEFERAIELCKAHLAEQRNHLSGHVVLAQTLVDSGRESGAWRPLQVALDLDPENFIALRLLGDLHARVGEVEQARSYFFRALEIEPRSEQLLAAVKALTFRPQAEAPSKTVEPDRPLVEPITAEREAAQSLASAAEAAAEPVAEPSIPAEDIPAEPAPEAAVFADDRAWISAATPAADQYAGADADAAREQAGTSEREDADRRQPINTPVVSDAVDWFDSPTPPPVEEEETAPELPLLEWHDREPVSAAQPSAEQVVEVPDTAALREEPDERAHRVEEARETEAVVAAAVEATTTAAEAIPDTAVVGPPPEGAEAPSRSARDAVGVGASAEAPPVGPEAPPVTSTSVTPLTEDFGEQRPVLASETMADLYLQQGHIALAVEVMRELLVTRPHDERLRSRLSELEARAEQAPRETVHDLFARFQQRAATRARESRASAAPGPLADVLGRARGTDLKPDPALTAITAPPPQPARSGEFDAWLHKSAVP